jgi:REP element-mobilizing transposase RayT
MTQRYRIVSNLDCPYFITCTIVDWLPIFADQDYRQIVLDSLAYLRENKRTQVNAFVVMSTHLHAVLWPEINNILSDVLRDFKRHTSRLISKTALQRNDHHYLEVFAANRQSNRAQDESQYQVWQEGSHPEAIYTLEFAQQKIDYIHNNPVKAGLAIKPQDWEYSSARAYELGAQTFPPTDMLVP